VCPSHRQGGYEWFSSSMRFRCVWALLRHRSSPSDKTSDAQAPPSAAPATPPPAVTVIAADAACESTCAPHLSLATSIPEPSAPAPVDQNERRPSHSRMETSRWLKRNRTTAQGASLILPYSREASFSTLTTPRQRNNPIDNTVTGSTRSHEIMSSPCVHGDLVAISTMSMRVAT